MKLQLASRPGETLHCFLRKRRHTRNLRWWCITGDFNAQTFIGASDVARQSHCPNAAPLRRADVVVGQGVMSPNGPLRHFACTQQLGRFRIKADTKWREGPGGSVENDPKAT